MSAAEATAHDKVHPSYVFIWTILLGLLFLSIGFGYLSNPVVVVVSVFFVAAVKAYLVVAYYMHLRLEPRFIAAILCFGACCVLILGFALVPDIVLTGTRISP